MIVHSGPKDPRWREISASLRKQVLYLKLPTDTLHLIAVFLDSRLRDPYPKETVKPHLPRLRQLQTFLQEEERQSHLVEQSSSFLALREEEAASDLEALKALQQTGGILGEFSRALELGLQNDPSVDWILRVGGPKPKPARPLPAMEDAAALIDSLFPEIEPVK